MAILEEMVGSPLEKAAAWDETARLALAGIVVRHAECGVLIPETLQKKSIEWLENEEIDWEEETKRRLRRDKEIALLRRAKTVSMDTDERPS